MSLLLYYLFPLQFTITPVAEDMASRLSFLSSSSNLATLNYASSKAKRPKIAVQAQFSSFSLLRETHDVDGDNSRRKLKHLDVIKGSHGGAERQKAKCAISPEKLEIFKSLEGWAEENILTLLKPVESSWQPQDLLPEPSDDEEAFLQSIREIRERAAGIPDEYYVCLVGNMITEEALPTYQSMLNTFDGVRDETGASMTPWARWIRMWTAEENRHGDVLNKYLYFTGRLDMRQIEKTIQFLIGSGMVLHSDHNPYRGFIYTSFQERATSVAHGNTARGAKAHGDATLARMCGLIAADEKRHETAYARIVEKLFEVDPDTTMRALADMMRLRITMPAALLFDGRDERLFDHYSAVAQRAGVYTTRDYGDILEYFLRRWNVEGVAAGLSPEGRRALDYVCALPQRIRKMEERAEERARASQSAMVPFSWIFDRAVRL